MTKKKSNPGKKHGGSPSDSKRQPLPAVPKFRKAYAHVHVNEIPPRFQWDGNNGYCGEVSLISAGLYYGQYLSQYDMRKIVSGINQRQQLLLGYNDGYAAAQLRLKYERIQSTDSAAFLTWIKHHVAAGHPVSMGVFNNVNILGEGGTGDPEYDHIVPVIGFASKNPLDAPYDPSDIILFSDNGLFTNSNAPMCVPAPTVPYYFHDELGTFCGNRQQANKNEKIYSLLGLPENLSLLSAADLHYTQNYAIAITGVMGGEETVPVRIATNLNYESPCIGTISNKRPAPMELELTVTVSGLVPGKKYLLYSYTDESEVPARNIRANSEKKFHPKHIQVESGTEFSFHFPHPSDKKIFFRAVPEKD